MVERLHAYLLERPAGAPVAELLPLVFTHHGRNPEFGLRFLATLLRGDSRFWFDAGDARWRLRVHDVLTRSLDAVNFVVVDLETTGGAPATSGITEIGAVRVRGGRIAERFATLVNPERPIQPFVTHLTGITDAMVADAPPIRDALPLFLEFAGPEPVLVAHNASFDAAHLEGAHRTVFGRALGWPTLCTIRLARRLLPELPRRSLEAVATHLGIARAGAHRGLPDAETAADILTTFLARARTRGIERLNALLDFQRSAADDRPLVVRVPRARLEALPDRPGIYHLLAADRRVLYVGKATSLRERVASYFVEAKGHARRTRELLRQVHDVEVTETGSGLAASLLEARRIFDLQPPYNRQRRQLPRVAFVKLGVRNEFPRVWVTSRLGADRAVYLGPYGSVDAAERSAAVLARVFGLRTCAGRLAPSPDVSPCLSGQVGTCPAPCAGRETAEAYRERVTRAVAFLEGRDETVLTRLEGERDLATRAHQSETAARMQRDMDELTALWKRRGRLGWIVGRQHFVVLVPTVDRRDAQLYAVLGGRLAFEGRLTAAADLVAAVRVVQQRYEQLGAAPLGRADVATATILAAWLRDRRQEGLVLAFDHPRELEDRLDELVVTLGDLRQRGPLPAIDGLA